MIETNGWLPIRQSGSHVIYKKGERSYPVPFHKGREVGSGLEKKIRKEMGLRKHR
ncbi:MAG: type II toxin-antitoxin system HicA family toxin [Bacteroidales bacterium]|nr:type II toxin-antitoxin system HicA family toxin [Bacteroidales bacterium]